MRERAAAQNDLLDRLAADPRLGLTRGQLDDVLGEPLSFAGTAQSQVQAIVDQVGKIVARYPAAAAYDPSPIV
jgi:adenylosuccinate lyase